MSGLGFNSSDMYLITKEKKKKELTENVKQVIFSKNNYIL